MATISSTLQMFDSFSRPLRNVTQALNMTISAMESLHSAADKNINMGKQFDAARRKIADADAELRMMADSINRAGREQETLTNKVNKTNLSMATLAKKAGGVAAAYLGFQQVKNFFAGMLGAGAELNALNQNLEQGFATMLGSAEKATIFLDNMMSFARNTPFAYPELAMSGRNLLAFGMAADNIIPVLNTIGDTVAGIGGSNQELMELSAAFGAIQASGRLSMMEVNRMATHGVPALAILANQAGVTGDEMRSRISKGAIDANTAIGWLVDGLREGTNGIAGQTAKFGGLMSQVQSTWTGALDKMAGARRRAGAGIMEPLMAREGPLIGFIGKITNMFNELPSIMAPAANAVASLINTLGRAFDSGKVTTAFSVLSVGVTIATYGVNALIWVFMLLWDIVQTGAEIAGTILYNLGAIIVGLSPIILGAAAAWAAYTLASNASAIGTVLVSIAMLSYYGIILLISGVTKVYSAIMSILSLRLRAAAIAQGLLNLVMAMNPIGLVTAAVVGLIVAMATLGNITNGLRGIFSSVFGFIVDTAQAAVNAVIAIINTGIKAINKVAGFFGSLLGVGTKQIQEIEFRADFSKVKSAGQNLIENFSMSDIAGKFKSAYSPTGVPDFNMGAFGDLGNIGKVGEVGKIKDKVDISSEDLKWMRDMAEQEVINRFTTATLAPQISIAFGDVRETADVDGLVKHIETILAEAINTSAEGVHA